MLALAAQMLLQLLQTPSLLLTPLLHVVSEESAVNSTLKVP